MAGEAINWRAGGTDAGLTRAGGGLGAAMALPFLRMAGFAVKGIQGGANQQHPNEPAGNANHQDQPQRGISHKIARIG